MTSGDELQLSTQFAQCLEKIDRLNRIIYKLDADVVARMWEFIERRHLADAYNDEQEAKRKK
jgi:hypothetical protein